jgi:hypothetical protein
MLNDRLCNTSKEEKMKMLPQVLFWLDSFLSRSHGWYGTLGQGLKL